MASQIDTPNPDRAVGGDARTRFNVMAYRALWASADDGGVERLVDDLCASGAGWQRVDLGSLPPKVAVVVLCHEPTGMWAGLDAATVSRYASGESLLDFVETIIRDCWGDSLSPWVDVVQALLAHPDGKAVGLPELAALGAWPEFDLLVHKRQIWATTMSHIRFAHGLLAKPDTSTGTD